MRIRAGKHLFRRLHRPYSLRCRSRSSALHCRGAQLNNEGQGSEKTGSSGETLGEGWVLEAKGGKQWLQGSILLPQHGSIEQAGCKASSCL